MFSFSTTANKSYISFSKGKIVSKLSNSPGTALRVHVFPSGELAFESEKYTSNYISVAPNGQLFAEVNSISAPGSDQLFQCYVKGCFRNKGTIMLCTSIMQTLCVDRDPSMLTANGRKNRLAMFICHKVGQGVRMFESVIFPRSFLQMKKGKIDCLGNGDQHSEFRIRRCRERNYIALECARERGYVGFLPNGQVKVLFDTVSSSPHCRIVPEVVEFGQKKGQKNQKTTKDDKPQDTDKGYSDAESVQSAKPSKESDEERDKVEPVEEPEEKKPEAHVKKGNVEKKTTTTKATKGKVTPGKKETTAKKTVAKTNAKPKHDDKSESAPAKMEKPLAPTIEPILGFDATSDAENLQDLIEKLEMAAIVSLLTTRSLEQRCRVNAIYRETHRKTLELALGSIMSGQIFNLISALLVAENNINEMFVHTLKRALENKDEKDLKSIIDVICTVPHKQLQEIMEIYQKIVGRSLESDLKPASENVTENPTSFIERLLSMMLHRPSSPASIDMKAIRNDCKLLNTASKEHAKNKKFYTQLASILSSRGHHYLRIMFETYKKDFKTDFEDVIRKTGKTGKETQQSLLDIGNFKFLPFISSFYN